MKKCHLLLINGIALGELFGLVFSLFFSYLYGLNDYVPSAPTFTDHFTRPLNAVLVSVILWGLMGLVFSAGALVFKVNYWTLRKRTIVNFAVYETWQGQVTWAEKNKTVSFRSALELMRLLDEAGASEGRTWEDAHLAKE